MSGAVVGIHEQIKVSAQPLVVKVVALNGSFLDCALHALDLSAIWENSPPYCLLILLAPRMIGFGQAMLDFIGVADHNEAAAVPEHGVPVSRLFSEMDDAAIGLEPMAHQVWPGQDDVDIVGSRLRYGLRKRRGRGSVGLVIKPDDGKFDVRSMAKNL